MALTLKLAGVDRTALFVTDTLAIADELNSRNTCSFELMDRTGTYRPAIGDAVLLEDGPTRLFAGTVDDLEEETLDGSATLWHTVSCIDNNQLADRHLVARVYEGQTLAAIVADIVAQEFAGEGITTAGVQTGPVIDKAVFNYRPAADCFNDLAELTGYSWSIDYHRDFKFFHRATYAAPFGLTSTSANFRKLKVKSTREQYRNRQYVRAGFDVTEPRTENRKGDGTNKAFLLTYPIGKVPTVKVNGVPKTVGIKGVETGFDWYWNKGEAMITQADGGAALLASDTLSVTYQGLVPILLVAESDQEVGAMKAKEGGSGLYEAIEDAPEIDKGSMAQAKGDALLRRFGRIPRTVEFETFAAGLAAGQLLPINVPEHALDGSFLIQSVKAQDVDGRFLRYTIKALDGESLGGWEDFFRRMGQEGRSYLIRENEVVTYLRRFTDAVVCGDSLTMPAATARDAVVCSDTLTTQTLAPESRVGYARVNMSEVA